MRGYGNSGSPLQHYFPYPSYEGYKQAMFCTVTSPGSHKQKAVDTERVVSSPKPRATVNNYRKSSRRQSQNL